MPLKDLFTKAPSPLPPTEEPWPRSESSSSCLRDTFKQSPLHSATARPTLDEFLRTNYLMIPDFLLQVNKAKIVARTGKLVNVVQNTTSGQSTVNLATDKGLPISSSSNVSSSDIVNNNDKEVKIVESRGIKEKDPKTAPEISNTKSGDKLFSALSRKQTYEEIQVPPPLKPKPRVKKVMKGGTLVTIPAPQPRNRARQGSAENGSKSTVSGIDLISSEGGENAIAVSEMSVKEGVEELSVKKSCDSQQLAKKDDSIIPCDEESDSIMQPGVSNKDTEGLGSGIVTEECQQRQDPLTFHSADVLLKGKNTPAKTSNHVSLNEHDSNKCVRTVSEADSSTMSPRKESEMTMSKDAERESDKEHPGEFTEGPKMDPSEKAPIEEESGLINEEPKLSNNVGEVLHKDHVGTLSTEDPKGMKISMDPTEETKKRPASQDSVAVGPDVEATNSPKKESSADVSHDIALKCSILKQSSVDDNAGQSVEEPNQGINSSTNMPERHVIEKDNNHLKTTGDTDHEINCSTHEQNAQDYNADGLKDVSLEGCDTTVVDADDDKNSDSGSSNSTDDDDDGGNDDDDDEKEEEEEEHGSDENNDVSTRDNPADDSSKEYAELIMDDSTSEEEEEYDFCPINENDSDEEEDEEKSDYEAEDMNLDSDTESSTGGITFYQDTTIGERVKHSRNKQREKRKAKNQRKKASKKRAKDAKQAAKAKNKSHDSTGGKKNFKDKQQLTPASQKKEAKEQPKNRGSVPGHKSAETASKPKPEARKPPPNNPPQESTSEDVSLLSMVSSCAVDLTVAASEKFFLKKRRGGQHSKKMKKAKRKAEALERIRRGEPPPRTRRVFQELPKPICTFYREGKCRKGSDCPFRHDRSALIKKKEVCKFYMLSADNCYAGDDCIFMHNSFPCKFFHTSRCWEGDRCRFSHDALTEETERLLQACLKPPIEDPVQSPEDKNLTTSNQQTADVSTRDAATSSSPYNLRASTRKRTLSTDDAGTGSGSMGGGKIPRQQLPGNEEEDSTQNNNEGQPRAFLPGLYRDLST